MAQTVPRTNESMEQGSGLKGSQIYQGESKFFMSECSSLNSSIVSYDSESDLDLSWDNVESFERTKYLKKAPSHSMTNGPKLVKVVKQLKLKKGKANSTELYK